MSTDSDGTDRKDIGTDGDEIVDDEIGPDSGDATDLPTGIPPAFQEYGTPHPPPSPAFRPR